MTNFKTPQTIFHLPVGYKHLLFGIDKEHIIAKAETNISEFSAELRSIPAIKHLLVWYLDNNKSADELNFSGGKSRRHHGNSVHYIQVICRFESELVMSRLRSKINFSRNSWTSNPHLIKKRMDPAFYSWRQRRNDI